jgi:hypothetical protein
MHEDANDLVSVVERFQDHVRGFSATAGSSSTAATSHDEHS